METNHVLEQLKELLVRNNETIWIDEIDEYGLSVRWHKVPLNDIYFVCTESYYQSKLNNSKGLKKNNTKGLVRVFTLASYEAGITTKKITLKFFESKYQFEEIHDGCVINRDNVIRMEKGWTDKTLTKGGNYYYTVGFGEYGKREMCFAYASADKSVEINKRLSKNPTDSHE